MTTEPHPTQQNQPTALRTHLCGVLRPADVGQTVTVCGWVARRREHGEHLAFVDLRDHTGIIQCVIDHATDVRSEWVIAVTGTVRHRPDGTVNPGIGTGEVEIGDCTVEVLNEAEPPPFSVDDRDESDEPVRLKYRYVDLRRPRMQRNLRLRARVNAALRQAMDRQGFAEIETPLLWAPTPEGSREFSVPSRLHHGEFYALPQSPQLAKQLLMVGGFDRYFQIARCLRDEDLRADRQFEFMQLDMECSFASQDDVMAYVSEAVLDAAEAATGERPPPIERLTWAESRDRFGTDKPDLRFGLELIDLTEVFAGTEVKAFSSPTVKAIVVPDGATFPRKRLDDLTEQAKKAGAAGLAWFRVVEGEDGNGPALDGPLARHLSEQEAARVLALTKAEPGDLILAVSDEYATACAVLGTLRVAIGAPPWARARIDTSGSSTSPCSTASGPTATRRRRTTRSPCRIPRTCRCWRRTRWPCARRPTTWCSTDGSWDRGVSVSTAGRYRSRCSPRWASAPRRPRRASGSCSAPSATGPRPTPGSPSGSTGWWRSWPARRTSARSSRTPRPSPGPTC